MFSIEQPKNKHAELMKSLMRWEPKHCARLAAGLAELVLGMPHTSYAERFPSGWVKGGLT
jgi:hypothetical protein